MPVTLPPGRARLSTRPALDRIAPTAHHNDGNRLGRILGRQDRPGPSCYHDDINLETHQLGRKLRETDRPSPPHIGTRWRRSVLLCSQGRAEPAGLPQNGRTHVAGSNADRYPIRGTFFACCASADDAKRKEHGAKRKDGDFSRSCFSLLSPLVTRHSTLTPSYLIHCSPHFERYLSRKWR